MSFTPNYNKLNKSFPVGVDIMNEVVNDAETSSETPVGLKDDCDIE